MIEITVLCGEEVVGDVSDGLGPFYRENSDAMSSLDIVSHDHSFGGIAIVKYNDPSIDRDKDGNLPITCDEKRIISQLIINLTLMDFVTGVLNDSRDEITL